MRLRMILSFPPTPVNPEYNHRPRPLTPHPLCAGPCTPRCDRSRHLSCPSARVLVSAVAHPFVMRRTIFQPRLCSATTQVPFRCMLQRNRANSFPIRCALAWAAELFDRPSTNIYVAVGFLPSKAKPSPPDGSRPQADVINPDLSSSVIGLCAVWGNSGCMTDHHPPT